MIFRFKFGLAVAAKCGFTMMVLMPMRSFFASASLLSGMIDIGITCAFLFSVIGLGIAAWNFYCLRKEASYYTNGLFSLERIGHLLGGMRSFFRDIVARRLISKFTRAFTALRPYCIAMQ